MNGNRLEHPDPCERIVVRLILARRDRGWIFGKFARRMVENLSGWNVEADISDVPSQTVDFNHWMEYLDLDGWRNSPRSTIFITHVDRPGKLHLLKRRLKRADIGICMSRMTMTELVARGVPGNRLCYISPAHDGPVKPRRIVIGMVRGDGKNGHGYEDLLIKLSETIRLDSFRFEIIGKIWEETIPRLQAAGGTVRFDSGDDPGNAGLAAVLEKASRFDYFLEPVDGEGSKWRIRVFAGGVPSLMEGENSNWNFEYRAARPFDGAEQLSEILVGIDRQRQSLVDSVSGLTWDEYARQHAVVWRLLKDARGDEIQEALHGKETRESTSSCAGSRLDSTARLTFNRWTNFRSLYIDVLKLAELYTGIHFQGTMLFRLLSRVKRSTARFASGTVWKRGEKEEYGLRFDGKCYVSSGFEPFELPGRLRIGITSKLRADKAKREDMLIYLSATTVLDAFHFEIIGSGWEKVIPILESAGATVRYYPGTEDGLADYRINHERVPLFDFYLYMGFDEGSMGYLDALSAGVPTIVTPQGFHCDISGGLTYPFSTASELRDIFQRLSVNREQVRKNISASLPGYER